MVRALLSEVCPEAVFELPDSDSGEDWGGVRVTLIETGRWLCVLPESAVPMGVPSALTAGCSSVLTVGSGSDDFSRALETLSAHGSIFVPSDLVQLMAHEAVAARVQREGSAAAAPNDSLVRLTDREREVLRLVAAGHSNMEIAQALTISTNTVRTHLHALAVKLDASSRTRILANARALGIAEAAGLERNANPRRSLSA
ncbi:MAG: response regulator transcription factor [Tepidiformaceae bacterium]